MSKSSSGFASNVLKLMSGRALSFGLGVLLTPIITRLFAPEAFGALALFTSIAGMIGQLACLRYERAIMLPGENTEAVNLLGVSLCCVLLVSIVSALFMLIAADSIAGLQGWAGLKRYVWLVPISVLFNGGFLALTYWNSRTKHFGRLAITGVVSSATTQVTRVGAGLAGCVTGGILIGTYVLADIVSFAVLGVRIWQNDGRLIRANVGWKNMVTGMKRYKKFPMYSIWAGLLNNVAGQLPVWLLAFYFSPAVVGFFALGRRVLTTPLTMVGRAIGPVFFQRAADAQNRTGDLSILVGEVFKRLVSIGIFPCLMLMLIGKEVFVVVFGAQWVDAGVYVQILALWIFFQFISSPLSNLISVLERQGFGVLFNILLLTTRAGSLIVGGATGNIHLTLVLFASTGVACYGFLCIWLLQKVGVPLVTFSLEILRYLAYACFFLIVIALVKWTSGLHSLGTLVVACTCVISYYFLIVRRDDELRKPVYALFERFGFIK